MTGGAASSSRTAELIAEYANELRVYVSRVAGVNSVLTADTLTHLACHLKNISGMTECPTLLRSRAVRKGHPEDLQHLEEVDGGTHLAWEPIADCASEHEGQVHMLWILASHPALLPQAHLEQLPSCAVRKSGSECDQAFCTQDLYRKSVTNKSHPWTYVGRQDDR